MSNPLSAGIKVAAGLQAAFQEGKHRWYSATVAGGEIALDKTGDTDFDGLAKAIGDKACYVAFRMDDGKSPNWLCIAYIPDTTPVREKMLMGSSRQDFKVGLGKDHFRKDFQIDELSDLTLANYTAHNDNSDVPRNTWEHGGKKKSGSKGKK